MFCFSSIFGKAHEANNAFFQIIEKGHSVEIQAEFPWSIRSALIQFNPSLENSSERKDFEKTFEDYIKVNLVLIDIHGDTMPFSGFSELPNNGHSHQNNYSINYTGENLSQIINTILFNVYDSQVNYHTYQFDGSEKTFETNTVNTHFTIRKPSQNIFAWVVFVGLLLGLLLFWKRTK